MTIVHALVRSLSDFGERGCTSLAASLAFFALLSFFPLIFVLLYLLSFVMSQTQIHHQLLLQFLKTFLPAIGPELALEIHRVANEQVVRWIVLLTFVWFAMLVLYELTYTINVVFEAPKRRHPIMSTMLSMGLLGLLEVLMVLSYVVSESLALLAARAPRVAGLDLVALAAHSFLLDYVLPFALVLVAITTLYRFLPEQRPSWREAALGGIIITPAWEIAKHLFGTYVTDLAVYGRMYGSLFAVVLFLIWIYYSAALLLFGAAFVHRFQVMRQPSTLSP